MNTKKAKNIALIVSVIAFAIGFSDAGESMFWHLGRPVGAILLGVYMIFLVLEKETALFDEQQERAGDLEDLRTASAPPANKENCAPALTTATSH